MKEAAWLLAVLAGGVAAGALLPLPSMDGAPGRGKVLAPGKSAVVTPVDEAKRALQESSAAARLVRFSAVVANAGTGDLPHLLGSALANPPLRDMVLRRWLEVDRAGLLAWLERQHRTASLEYLKQWEDAFGTVTELMALTSPADALAAARSWKFLSDDVRRKCAGLALHAAFDANPAEGLKLFIESGEPDTSVGTGWIARHPEEAQRLIPQMPVGLARGQAVNYTLSLLREKDSAAAVKFMAQFPLLHRPMPAWLPGGPQTYPHASLYAEWAQKDRQAVIDYANDHASGHLRAGLLAAVSAELGKENPAQALEWTRENLSGEARHSAVRNIFSNLAEKDAGAAIGLIDAVPGTSRAQALEGVVRARAAAAPEETLGSYLAMPASSTRDDLIRETVRGVFAGGLRETEFKTWLGTLSQAQADEVRRLAEPPRKSA